jgi:hypothetical protein
MKAVVGDKIIVMSRHVGEPVREGEIVEVHGVHGGPPYVVRWHDGAHTGVLYPGPDANVIHGGAGEGRAVRPASSATVRAKQWEVTVSLVEYDSGLTKSHVVVHTGDRTLQAHGEAQRLGGDVDVPEIGDEVAAGRAFHALSEELFRRAAKEIEEVEGHRAVIRRTPRGLKS